MTNGDKEPTLEFSRQNEYGALEDIGQSSDMHLFQVPAMRVHVSSIKGWVMTAISDLKW